MEKRQTINWQPFSQKHKHYIKHAMECKMSVAEGAIRSGKTIDNCIIAAMYLEKCPDKYHLASGSTIANAKMNIGVCNGFGLEQLFRGRCKWGKFQDNDALFIKTQTGDKVVIFAGGAKANSYQKILGNSYGLWIATEINEHFDSEDSKTSFIKVAFGRQTAAIKPMVLWDLNPSNPSARIYSDYIDRYEESYVGGYQLERFTMRDNRSISPERMREIESQYAIGSVWYRRDILGERCIAEGLIYPMYEKALGEPPEPIFDASHHWLNPPEERCISMDYGTMNAFAALLWEKYGETWYAVREYYYSGRDEKVQKTDSDYLRDLETWLADIIADLRYGERLEVIIDPSAKSFITLLHRTGWAKVREADNDIKNGIAETANAMENGYIKISRKLENEYKEVSGYRWDAKAGEKGIDAPVKINDHLQDAKRYFVKTKKVIKKATRRDRIYGY